MPPFASPRTPSWWPKGPLFPPHKRVAALSSKCLPFPKITGRGALPIRTQRHVPDSIATLRYEITAYLAATLERCPCCTKPRSTQKIECMFDAVGLVTNSPAAAQNFAVSPRTKNMSSISRSSLRALGHRDHRAHEGTEPADERHLRAFPQDAAGRVYRIAFRK